MKNMPPLILYYPPSWIFHRGAGAGVLAEALAGSRAGVFEEGETRSAAEWNRNKSI